jgi:hypothetical protein
MGHIAIVSRPAQVWAYLRSLASLRDDSAFVLRADGLVANHHAIPARTVLDPAFSKKGCRPEPVSSAAGDVGSPSGPGGELRCQSLAHARISGMDRSASFPVCAASRPSAGLACASDSDRAANHAVRHVPRSLRFPTQHLLGG